jgi:hypothetical protein
MAIIDKETGEIISDTGGELTVQDRAKLALKSNDTELINLAEKSKELVEIKTKENYTEIKNAETPLVKMRLAIKETGKLAREDANAYAKAVIAEEKRLLAFIEPEEERLKALRFDWDEAIRIEKGKEFAIAEEKRLRLLAIEDSVDVGLNFGDGVTEIEKRIEAVKSAVIDGDELTDEVITRLSLKRLTSLNVLENALASAKEIAANNSASAELKRISNEKAVSENAQKAIEEQKRIAIENGPDSQKLDAWINDIRNVPFPVMNTNQGQQTKLDIINALDSLLDRASIASRKMIDLN